MKKHYEPLRTCPICEKRFIPTAQWLYKGERGPYYCSYTCYRKAGGDQGIFKHMGEPRIETDGRRNKKNGNDK